MSKRLLGGVFVAALVLLMSVSSSALAAGSPVAVASGGLPEYLSVATDSSGDAVAAWAEKSNPGNEVVRWCVTAPGGSGCSAGGSLTPAAGTAGQTYVYGTKVLVEGSTLVILAEVDVSSTTYESVQEWQSTDGGRTFVAVDGGRGVASGNPSADTQVASAVTLPGSTEIGVGFLTAGEAPTFHAFPLANPTPCGRATGSCPTGYATLAPSSDPDQASNDPANFVANSNGVLGVFRTNYSSGNFACTGATPFGMAYTYGTGVQSPSNNYNVSPGQASTAWRTSLRHADCDVDYIAAGAGPSGFGVLEDNQVTGQTQYHRFDEATGSFDGAPTIVSAKGEQQPSVSQDGAGGVYAVYLSGGIGGPVSLSYSFNGGSTWSGPGTLATDPLGRIAGLTSSVDAVGQGWAAWTENGAVFVEPFSAADSVPAVAPTTLSTSQRSGSQTGASLSVPAGTVGMTDQATIGGANAAAAGGTVTYGLYSSQTCGAASLIASSTVGVNGAVAPASAPIAATLVPGSYYWQATYSGNPSTAQGAVGNGPSSSACGSEVLTITSPVTIGAQATSNGKTLTFQAACAVVPCTIGAEAIVGPPAAKAEARKTGKKHGKAKKKVTLGKGSFKIAKAGSQKLTLKLSGGGRRYLAGKRGKVRVTLVVTEKIGSQNVATTRAVSVKVEHRKPKKPKKK